MSEVARDGLGDVRAETGTAEYPGGGAHHPIGGAQAGPIPRARAGRTTATIVAAATLAVFFLGAAWFATRRGIFTDTWPAFLADTDSTSITRYSGPWLTAAAAAVLGAGVSIMTLVRALRSRSAR